MNLPPGFQLDEQPKSNLPPGFVLDQPGQTQQPGLLRRGAEAFIKSPALPMIGGIVGGIAGAPLGPGAIGTAALGGAAGEGYRQMGARAMGLDAPQTSLDAAKGIGIEGAIQGASEGIGMGVVAPAARMAGRILKKPLGQAFEIATKMKPQDAATLFRNPSAILPSRFTKAAEGWKTAAEGIGIPTNEVNPDILRMLQEPGGPKKMVYETYQKILNGEAVTAREAQMAKQALDISVMPEAKTIRKNPLVSTLNQIRHAFTERIGKESPEMAAANREYGIAATGKKFRSLFPTNKTGDPAYFRSSILPLAGLVSGSAQGDPIGNTLKYTGAQLAISPLGIGGMIAGAGMARPLAPILGRAIVSGGTNLSRKILKGKEDVGSESGSKNLFNPPSGNTKNNPNEEQNGYSRNQNQERIDYQVSGFKENHTPSFNPSSPEKSIDMVPKSITKEIAQRYLKRAKEDGFKGEEARNEARRLARKDNYTWE